MTETEKGESHMLSESSSYSEVEIPQTENLKAQSEDETGSDATEDFKQLSRSETMAKYRELIDECQRFAATEEIDDKFLGDITKNINSGCYLNSRSFHAGLYMAYLHGTAVTNVLRAKSEALGRQSAVFNLDSFIQSVKNSFKGNDEEFVPRKAQLELSKQFGEAAQLSPSFQMLLGSFEKLRENAILPLKEKTVRGAPLRKRFDNDNATKHEVVITSKEKRGNESADHLSKSILEVLKKQHSKTKEPVNFLEFIFDKDSLARTVENMFCTGFLAREGFVSVAHKTSEQSNSILVLEPTEPPYKKEDPEHANRQQFIWSFTPQQWKKLAEVASGDTVIVPSQRSSQLN